MDLQTVRSVISSRTVNLSQWMAVAEAPLNLLLPLPESEAADVSRIRAARNPDDALRAEVTRILDERVPGRRGMSLLVISADSVRDDHL